MQTFPATSRPSKNIRNIDPSLLLVGRQQPIKAGKFEIDGEEYTLPINDGLTLHGGLKGPTRDLGAQPLVDDCGASPSSSIPPRRRRSYPGKEVMVVYTLGNDDTLTIVAATR